MSEINNETLFFKVWRNNYLKFLILKECKLYKDNRKRYFSNGIELRNYEFREYIEVVSINNKRNYDLQEGDLPKNGVLKSINIIGGILNSSIIPNGVTSVRYPEIIDHTKGNRIDITNLPPSVNSLENLTIDDFSQIPQSITSINFNPIMSVSKKENSKLSYDQIDGNETGIPPYKKKLSENLKTIKFGFDWDNKGSKLNHNDLPCNLLTLDLGSYKNILERNVLPNSITSLVVKFNESILKGGVLPKSLKKLILSFETNVDIKFNEKKILPEALEYLKILFCGNESNIYIGDYILSKSLKSLEIFGGYKDKKTLSKNSFIHLNQLEHISFGDNWGSLNDFILPNSGCLTSLDLGSKFNETIEKGVLPSSIKILKLGNHFNKSIVEDSFPINLEQLYFGVCFNQLLPPNHLPKNLKHLFLSNDFDKILEVGSLPNGLKKLKIGEHNGRFNQPISINVLPPTLENLELNCKNYEQLLNLNILPTSLSVLKIRSSSKFKKINHDFIKNLPNSIKLFIN
ncbi:hypothetical protein RB653_008833 [Dictyostelium firmibasis]|uniref:FNIP repeat-containing protein n=1 Tax=Dictyostelium firmibasis TaxID=79012 RepID=A0AAN7YPL4_9MYCE